jgi:hypothetical protein
MIRSILCKADHILQVSMSYTKTETLEGVWSISSKANDSSPKNGGAAVKAQKVHPRFQMVPLFCPRTCPRMAARTKQINLIFNVK